MTTRGHHGLMLADAGGGAWATTYSNTGGSDSGSVFIFTLRDVIAAAGITAGTKMRITMQAGAWGLSIAGAYIQTRGAGAYAYSTTPIACQYSGSGIASVGANAELVTDEIAFVQDGTLDVVFAVYCTGGNVKLWPEDGIVSGYYEGADVASSLNPTMADDTVIFIKKVEVFS